jgi:arabinan endo-1,5-alpha-L-arabinosidase
MGRYQLITGFLIMLGMQAGSFLKGDVLVTNNPSINVIGDVSHVHDPCMIKEGNTFYLFSTGKGIPVRTSRDMKHWVTAGVVFHVMPDWISSMFPEKSDAWAPDISFFNGEYHLYYAISTFGSNCSVIGLATNKTLNGNSPEYRWVDRGAVLESKKGDDWNAIDPNLCLDENGTPWLSFGSFWSGLKIVKLDKLTGKPAGGELDLSPLARRPDQPDAIESPFIIHRKNYYYLFASFDFCCRGAQSTYNVRVGRSKNITGPYMDMEGVSMLDGGGSEILTGTERWKGPGGESLYRDVRGRWWMTYHAYDAKNSGIPTLRINRIKWSQAGWPLPLSPNST